MSGDLVCTLFEGDYHIGAGTLLNSLHRSGFKGTAVCGYRGPLPAWNSSVVRLEPMTVVMLEMSDLTHLTYQKPQFMEFCAREVAPEAETITYLDPDIVMKARWEVIRKWVSGGLALVEDVNGHIPARHPMRLIWREWLLSHGFKVARELDRYVNAGMVGVERDGLPAISRWAEVIDASTEDITRTTLKNQRPDGLFRHADQDALNMALEATDVPLNMVGPEGMDFAPGGELVSHAIGTPKPWHGKALRRAVGGHPPSLAHKAFLDHLMSPLEVVPRPRAQYLSRSTKAAAMIGRFYSRH